MRTKCTVSDSGLGVRFFIGLSTYFLFFLFNISCCPEPYPDITFYIRMRRIPGFFLFNIIIPCLVVTSFSVLTFAFPPEFGERVTLVIESFLAMSVVILNVSDSIPVTSDATPIIVKILLAAMFQIGGALVANCISLNCYKKTEMPQWVRVFFLHYLARMLCIDTGHPKANVRSTRRIDVKVRRTDIDSSILIIYDVRKTCVYTRRNRLFLKTP